MLLRHHEHVAVEGNHPLKLYLALRSGGEVKRVAVCVRYDRLDVEVRGDVRTRCDYVCACCQHDPRLEAADVRDFLTDKARVRVAVAVACTAFLPEVALEEELAS